MGKLGNCCCTCYVPDNYELPTITKTGWTASNWTGTCCKCMTLTPNDPLPWNTCCSAEFLNQELIQSFTRYFYKIRLLKENSFDGTIPFPGWSNEHFCFGHPFNAYQIDFERTVEKSFKLLSGLRYDKIEVCISKQDITCGEASPVEKWIVISRFYFNYVAFLTWGLNSSSNSNLIIHNDCWIAGDGWPATCEQSRPLNCDFQSVYDLVFNGTPGDVDASLLKSGFGYFTRVKFYDTLPTGTVTFSNADVPGDCTWESCGSEEEYDNDFCINISSIPGNIGCSCNSNSVAGDPIVYSGNLVHNCTGCFAFPGSSQTTGNEQVASFCDGDAFFLQCIMCPDPHLGCDPDSYTFEIPGNATTIPEDSCTDPLYDDSWMSFGCQFEVGSEPQYSTDTSSDCYWQEACNNSPVYGYYNVGFEFTAYPFAIDGDSQWEINCTFTPVSCCFNAPSWSVNFG